jgi:hypothetical protein
MCCPTVSNSSHTSYILQDTSYERKYGEGQKLPISILCTILFYQTIKAAYLRAVGVGLGVAEALAS